MLSLTLFSLVSSWKLVALPCGVGMSASPTAFQFLTFLKSSGFKDIVLATT